MAQSIGRACVLCAQVQKCTGSSLSLAGRVWPVSRPALAGPLTAVWTQQTRPATNKHYDPRWKKQRARKVFKVELPNYNQKEENMTTSEMRGEMKKRGKMPPRGFQERNLIISSTASLLEPYVPPEGDGVASLISAERAKQRMTELEKKGKSVMQVRQIKKFDEDFNTKEFAQTAQDIYIEAHKLLEDIEANDDRLHELVTEKAYPEMVWLLEKKTVRWQYLEALEPPRVVHVRVSEMLSKDNKYAQVTVRLHTKQTLAIYDRFGRLSYGGENLTKNVLEYVVFEKHLSDEYGLWRIHGKIIPDWMPPRQPVLRTIRKPKFKPIEDATDDDAKDSGASKKAEEKASKKAEEKAAATA